MDIQTLLASAIHDVKNELHLLSPDLTCLLESIDEKTRSAAGRITRRVDVVDRRLVRLLLLYRFASESGRVPISISEVYVSDLLNTFSESSQVADGESEGAVEHSLASRSHSQTEPVCEINCDSELVGFFDENLVGSVLRDALDNARRFAQSRIVISASGEQGGTRIIIEDDGAGPDGTENGALASGNTGLGMYLAQSVAEAHGNKGVQGYARLERSANLGGGAFVLYLP